MFTRQKSKKMFFNCGRCLPSFLFFLYRFYDCCFFATVLTSGLLPVELCESNMLLTFLRIVCAVELILATLLLILLASIRAARIR